MHDAAIFDMDGTLTDVSGIRHHVTPSPRRQRLDFDAFHRESVDCPPHGWVVDMARDCDAEGIAVVVVTARRARWRHHTAWWLALHRVPSAALFMRHDRDGRPDAVVKRDILGRIRRSWNPVLAVDDQPAVLAVWESAGIPTIRVPGWSA